MTLRIAALLTSLLASQHAFANATDHRIDLATARQLTARFQSNAPSEIKYFALPKAPIQEILATAGVAHLKAYQGKNADGTRTLVFIGADSNGAEITSTIVDMTQPCPQLCDGTSALSADPALSPGTVGSRSNVDHRISLDAARQLTARFQSQRRGEPRYFSIPKEPMQDLLSGDAVTTLRAYPATNPDGTRTIVYIGADANDNELTSKILDFTSPCPQICSATSAL